MNELEAVYELIRSLKGQTEALSLGGVLWHADHVMILPVPGFDVVILPRKAGGLAIVVGNFYYLALQRDSNQ